MWQWYRNRDDLLEIIETDYDARTIFESYDIGRTDSLRRKNSLGWLDSDQIMDHFRVLNDTTITNIGVFGIITGLIMSMEENGKKTFEFYEKSRLDGLLKLEVAIDYIKEYYEYRKYR